MIAPLLAAVLAVSAVAVAGALSIRAQQPPGAAPRSLRIHGHVNGMFPGRAATLRLHVRNPLAVRVGVYRIRVHVQHGSGPYGRCPARMLRVRPWHGLRRIPGGASRMFRLHIRMRRRAPDRCQGARWDLTYEGTSVRV